MNMKKLAAALAASALLLAACGSENPVAPDSGTVKIVATLFPQYDFAREVAGTNADITLLIPPGVESHSYEPSPADMIKIQKADLFVYTGDTMEPWAKTLLSGQGAHGPQVLDISKGIPLDAQDDEDAGADVHAGAQDAHGHIVDPHIWTSPVLAKRMVENLRDSLRALDAENADVYTSNAQSYLERLDALDARIRETVAGGKRREAVFAGRFAFHYFFKEYGLTAVSAYDSCSTETEPSARAVADIMDKIRADGIPAVYYEELTDPKVARVISGQTGAQALLLHSCHNVSKEDFQSGVTYLSLMGQNVENLRKGLL